MIYRKIRNIMSPGKSAWAIVGGTATMAFGLALFEIPCTVGFPLIWTKIIAEHNPEMPISITLFLLYVSIYLLDEIAVFAFVALTLRCLRFEERHGRMLRLIGGMIMLA